MVAEPSSTPDNVLRNGTGDALQVSGSLWLHRGNSSLGGQARIALLEHIASQGSITSAAKAAGMSYKAAWDAVDAMNQLAGEPLVERSTGGRGGGGTRLTPRGAKLVAAFRAVEAAQQQFLARVANDLEHFDEQWPVIARLGLQTSARNQLHGTITAIRRCGVNDEVTLTLPGGEAITASLTHHSTQTLGLAVGAQAFALIKAPWIEIARGADLAGLPTANRLSGTVDTVTDDAGQAEVILALPGGSRLAAVMPHETLSARGLTAGIGATAAFAAASVIIGVMA
ncbi:TOBE domain-containing protein [Pandoraea oxalativorans]|uniref:Molybdenum-dependent transcriptional regulator n=1 Tax=Pandoraea oxalativorans TaxID=573737 RepID=A0A0E3Y9B7_9BURK|nr:TOBE domain-containing protein [Pandoraea oxalativorans]AKC68951.1 molybdenum-dependent transcriptional regulator [Pandoraea oxalativorans]